MIFNYFLSPSNTKLLDPSCHSSVMKLTVVLTLDSVAINVHTSRWRYFTCSLHWCCDYCADGSVGIHVLVKYLPVRMLFLGSKMCSIAQKPLLSGPLVGRTPSCSCCQLQLSSSGWKSVIWVLIFVMLGYSSLVSPFVFPLTLHYQLDICDLIQNPPHWHQDASVNHIFPRP